MLQSQLKSKKKSGPIVLIEDDNALREQMTEFLSELGYNVSSADNGKNALSLFKKKPWTWAPWLVITDLVMPGMGGYQIMRRIPELYPGKNTHILAISNLVSQDDIAEAELAGANYFLKKPFSNDELVEAIVRATTPKGSEKLL